MNIGGDSFDSGGDLRLHHLSHHPSLPRRVASSASKLASSDPNHSSRQDREEKIAASSAQNPISAPSRKVLRAGRLRRKPPGWCCGLGWCGTDAGWRGLYVQALFPNRMAAVMAKCETCGNDYDKAFQVSMNGRAHTFDSFECAIHALAPTCANCGIHIVGHGLEKEGTFFCCEHCAEAKGVTGLRDRIGAGGVIEMGSGT
jgi:hypothetical protein